MDPIPGMDQRPPKPTVTLENRGPWARSAKSQAIGCLRGLARERLPHHSATAKQYCPSSSVVVRHSKQALAKYRNLRKRNSNGFVSRNIG
jgi:hypothetical protein